MSKRYTFIINTYPSEQRKVELPNTLSSIFKQTLQDFTVLVVENYKDQTGIKPLMEEFSAYKDRIEVISDSKKKLSYLFEIGWRNCQTELIAYVADDVELESDWLEKVNEEFLGDENIGVVTGPIISSCFPAGEMHRLYLLSQRNIILKMFTKPYLYLAMENKPLLPGKLFESGAYSLGAALEEAGEFPRQEIDLATTSSMGIRRSILEKLDGFDTSFNFNHADGDLFIRIKKAGFKIIFSPKVVSRHHLRMGPSRNAHIIGLDTGIFYRKHVRPKSLRGWVGAIMNIFVLNMYWIYNFFRTKDAKQLKGISGFIRGILD